ncbi:MAG: hypothetical protein JXJ17_19625 [Anaerolineae bacterium]|nr:hypothetical protein [Anaerolineae bacterium]
MGRHSKSPQTISLNPSIIDEPYTPGSGQRVLDAIYMLDATFGVGRAISWLLALSLIAWFTFGLVTPRMVSPRYSEEDRLALDRQLQWPVLVREDFEDKRLDSDADWALGDEYADNYDVYRELYEGQYFCSVAFYTAGCCEESPWLITQQSVEDFVISADFTKYSSDDGPSYGFIYHYQDAENFYAVTFNDVKNLTVEVIYQGEWQVIFTKSFHSAILPFERNRLRLSVEDGVGRILINDQYVGRFDSSRLPQGHLGFVIGSPYERADVVTLGIDNVTLRTPDENE